MMRNLILSMIVLTSFGFSALQINADSLEQDKLRENVVRIEIPLVDVSAKISTVG